MSKDSIFTRIIRREIPADVVHEDDICIAFRDVDPKAPIHILVVPKQPLAGLQAATANDRDLLGHLLVVAAQVAEKQGLDSDGYRCVVNAGADGSQTVDHLHVHLLGGRRMEWPPG